MQVCFRQGLHSSQRAVMVSLHTPWDAFSFVSESLVSFRASYRRTEAGLATETMAFPSPSRHRGAGPPAQPGHMGCLFPPLLWLTCSQICPPGIPSPSGSKHPLVFKIQLLLSPFQPLELIWTAPFSDAALTVSTPGLPSR